MARLEIIIYDDNGKILGKLSATIDAGTTTFAGRTFAEAAAAASTISKNPVADLARRNGVYTSPARHMQANPAALKLHNDVVGYCAIHFECGALSTISRSLHELWWLWHDTPDLVVPRFIQQLQHAAKDVRIAYAGWLMAAFEGHGIKGRDGRYTVRKYLSAFKRGELKAMTFDGKLDAARERLEMLRRSSDLGRPNK